MRKRYRVLIFAALVAALVVPVGYALSVESVPSASHSNASFATVVPAGSVSIVPAAAIVAAPVIHATSGAPAAPILQPASDSVKLFGIGTLLFGLAAFVRKAI
jgi:uncharacterized membrane protein